VPDRLDYPATRRNREPILEVLRRVLPPSGRVLEIASGSGQHHVHFARALPRLVWQPTDIDPRGLASVAAWQRDSGLDNLLPPLRLDVTEPFPVEAVQAVFCANMVHIAPWPCTLGLLEGAAAALVEGGRLVLYGPYKVEGRHTSESNVAFDQSLRSRDPSWGVRDLERVLEEAEARGLRFVERVQMPANNLMVVLEREPELSR
jgi:SAM-dependent methyltransferase